MELLSILFLLLLVISVLRLFSKSKNDHSSSGYYPPGLQPYPIIGHLPQFLKNRHRSADWLAEILAATPSNTFTFRRPGGVRGIVTANPTNVEYVLRAHFDNYPKGPKFISHLHDFLGHGIFNSDGEVWRLQRKTASLEFNTKSLRAFVVSCVRQEILTRLFPLMIKSSENKSVIDLQDVLERFAFDSICKLAFNLDPACLAADDHSAKDNFSSSFTLAFKDAANLSSERFQYALPGFWKIKKLFNVGTERRLKESINTVHSFATQIIRSRKTENKSASSTSPRADDLLSRFVVNEDYSEEFLRDIVVSFLLAGRDTTSSALTWFFWILSSHPDVESKIVDEIRSVRAGHQPKSDALDFEELREMQYLHAAITESMRLYPPVPVNSAICMSDDLLPDGTAVKKGWFVSYNSYAMGRMEATWGKDCMDYRPERWLEEDGKFRPESPFKFPAFHAGPRICLGKEMAYIQMKSIAACILERFVVEPATKEASPAKMMSLTLRMTGGLPVRVTERKI